MNALSAFYPQPSSNSMFLSCPKQHEQVNFQGARKCQIKARRCGGAGAGVGDTQVIQRQSAGGWFRSHNSGSALLESDVTYTLVSA